MFIFTAGLAHAGTPAIKPVSKLTVYDAHGKKVGQVMDILSAGWDGFIVPISVGKTLHVLRVTPDGQSLQGTTDYWRIFYTSTDCTGQAWVSWHPDARAPALAFPTTVIGPPRHTLYMIDTSLPLHAVAVRT